MMRNRPGSDLHFTEARKREGLQINHPSVTFRLAVAVFPADRGSYAYFMRPQCLPEAQNAHKHN